MKYFTNIRLAKAPADGNGNPPPPPPPPPPPAPIVQVKVRAVGQPVCVDGLLIPPTGETLVDEQLLPRLGGLVKKV